MFRAVSLEEHLAWDVGIAGVLPVDVFVIFTHRISLLVSAPRTFSGRRSNAGVHIILRDFVLHCLLSLAREANPSADRLSGCCVLGLDEVQTFRMPSSKHHILRAGES